MKLLLRFLGFLFAAGTTIFLAGIGAAAVLLWHYSQDLPDYSQLQNYEPPVMTRVHAADGSPASGAFTCRSRPCRKW
jgi:penicillin-binding protein 1A